MVKSLDIFNKFVEGAKGLSLAKSGDSPRGIPNKLGLFDNQTWSL